MSDADDHQHYDLHRLVVLSDAVFAIAMTLLALEVQTPVHWDGTIPSLLTAMQTPLLAYGMSFVIIFGYWRIHCRSFRYFVRADRFVIVFTILSLGLVTLLPVATRLFLENRQARGAMMVYASLAAAIGVLNALAWGVGALSPSMMHPHVTRAHKLARLISLLLAPVVAFGGSFLAFSGRALWALALLVALMVGVRVLRSRWDGESHEIAGAPAAPAVHEERHRPAPAASGKLPKKRTPRGGRR